MAKRSPVTLIVVFEGDAKTPWAAEAYDKDGYIHSYVNGYSSPKHTSREYVANWIAEYFPSVPIEVALKERKRRSPRG